MKRWEASLPPEIKAARKAVAMITLNGMSRRMTLMMGKLQVYR